MNPYQSRWNKLFADQSTGSVDIIGSFSEGFLNDFFAAHFRNNKAQYSLKIEREFNDQNAPRKFTLNLQVIEPLQILLPPFTNTKLDKAFNDRSNWARPVIPQRQPVLQASDKDKPTNVRVIGKMGIQLRWPKLSNPKEEWVFPEKGQLVLNCLIVANIELQTEKETHDSIDIRHVLRLSVVEVKFDQTSKEADLQRRKLLQTISKTSPLPPEEQKFADLIVIAMNVAATEYAPKLVQDLPLPTPVVQKRKLYPALFDLGEKIGTVGFSLDIPAYISEVREAIESQSKRFDALLAEDLEALGGIDGLTTTTTTKKLKPDELFPRSSAYLHRIAPAAKKQAQTPVRSASSPNFAVAVDEYLLDTLAADVMPEPSEGCTEWKTILEAVRGRICHWVRLFDPDVTVTKPANVQGSVHVDIGGAIEACIRRFWDCSWKWECGKLSLAIVGVPGVQFLLESSKTGVRFRAKILGDLRLSTNLPWPFNKVVEALSALVWQIVRGFINIVLAQITFEIVPEEIAFGNLNVKINLSEFTPEYFERTNIWKDADNHPASRLRFISIAAVATSK